ncbi:MAG TPA: BON domain-containing protein [Gemmatimonadales bacterium]|nr:BON domain-containing protein [Gemmatimonadales bacterium]
METMLYTDSNIQKDIGDELKWEPSLRDDDIAVGVRDGIVTLGGFVDSYADKSKAERAAARVKGVKAVANELEVKLPTAQQRTDPDIARAAVDALKWNIAVPHDRIQVKVEKGWLTLDGKVDWFYQKEAAERAVRYLTGVRGVYNLITLAASVSPGDVKKRIKETLHRGVEFDAERITVEVAGHKAILEGAVRSYVEMKDVERAARNAPGITEVENRLIVTSTFAAV